MRIILGNGYFSPQFSEIYSKIQHRKVEYRFIMPTQVWMRFYLSTIQNINTLTRFFSKMIYVNLKLKNTKPEIQIRSFEN